MKYIWYSVMTVLIAGTLLIGIYEGLSALGRWNDYQYHQKQMVCAEFDKRITRIAETDPSDATYMAARFREYTCPFYTS